MESVQQIRRTRGQLVIHTTTACNRTRGLACRWCTCARRWARGPRAGFTTAGDRAMFAFIPITVCCVPSLQREFSDPVLSCNE